MKRRKPSTPDTDEMKDISLSNSSDTLETLSDHSIDSMDDDIEEGLHGNTFKRTESWHKQEASYSLLYRLTIRAICSLIFGIVIIVSCRKVYKSPSHKLVTGTPITPALTIQLREHINRRMKSKVTVRLKKSRIDTLFQSVERISKCKSVAHIQIVGDHVPASLTNREKIQPYGKVYTDAVLLLEDSVDISCSDITRGTKEWRQNPGSSVGFFSLRSGSSYTLLSDRALILHRSLLMDLPPTGERHECQQYVAAARAYAVTDQLPIAMASVYNRESKYLPKLHCNDLVAKAFGGLSLVQTHVFYTGRSKLHRAKSNHNQ